MIRANETNDCGGFFMDIDREKEGKCLTVTVPCYNSESYLERCVESLLKERDGLEIILVDDGSTDRTGQLADQYARAYPDVVRVVHKKNGGHGSGVNAGLMLANGIYFKVVDSDDWLDEAAFHKLMSVLRFWCRTKEEKRPDLVVCNYVYDHLEEGKTKAVRYGNLFPEQKICRWDEIGCFSPEQYLVMHALIFRTGVLYDCGLKLPEHTFYVDNIYVFEPLPYVRNMYYLDVNFYRYFIGRSDQSVNEKVMTGRIDQQIKVNQIMTDYFVEKKSEIIGNKPLAKYMLSYLDIITTISSILLIRINTPESLEKKRELLNYIRQRDKKVYRKLRYGLLGNCMNLPGKTGRWISVEGYKICQKFFGFN